VYVVLGNVFGTGAELAMAGLVVVILAGLVVVIFAVGGSMFVVSVVWLPLVVRCPCILVALEMGVHLGLAFGLLLGGKGSLSLGGGRPAGDMAACSLVTLTGVRGGSWFGAAFCFLCCGRVPGTIAPTCQQKQASY
jgi:hypothetical protein